MPRQMKDGLGKLCRALALSRSISLSPFRPTRPMTEAEARNLLRRFDAVGGLEAWTADQR